MKQSKESRSLHWIGVFFFGVSAILYLFTLNMEVVFIGFFAFCIFCILGIEEDLYKREERKNHE